MRTRVPAILVLLLLSGSVRAGAPPSSSSSGRFTLYAAGREAGAEEWTLVAKNGSRVLESRLTLDLPAGAQELSLTATFDAATGELRSFLARGVAGGRERLLRLVRDGDRLTGEIREGEAARSVSLPAVPGTIPLVDPFTAPYLLLLSRYDRTRGGEQRFPLVYPLTGETGEVPVVRREEQAITLDGRALVATRLLARPDRAEVANLWVDGDGKLLVAARSVAGISAVRGQAARIGLRPGEDPPVPEGAAALRIRLAGPAGILAGTFTRPEGTERVPAALILAGSGPQDRNGNEPASELQWNPLASFAEALVVRGIASLRYDERGVGRSGGTFADAGFTDLLADARSALDYLASRDDVDPGRIAVVGHSEGALLAAALAADGRTPVKAVVLLGAPAEPLDRILVAQISDRLAARDLPERDRQRIVGEFRAFLEHVRLSTVDRLVWDGRGREVKWLREHMELDPLALYRHVRVPALVVQGERDAQVPPSHAARVGAALASPGGAAVRLRPGLDHYLMPGSEDLRDYGDARRRVDPGALGVVGDWLEGVFR